MDLLEGIDTGINLTDFVQVRMTNFEMIAYDHTQYDMTGKVILSINIPFGRQNEYFQTYKVMLRHQNSHAIVNAAFSALIDPSSNIVLEQPVIVYGGVLATAMR